MMDTMQRVVVTYRPEDVRRIAVTCRCGHHSVFEIPIQVAYGLNLVSCDQCHRTFTIQKIDARWDIQATGRKMCDYSVTRD